MPNIQEQMRALPVQVRAALGLMPKNVRLVQLPVKFQTTGSSGDKLFSDLPYTEQSSGAERSIKSADANDTVAGTGMRRALITYIREDGTEGTTEVDLNGTTPVPFGNDDDEKVMHINSVVGSEFGSNNAAVGQVDVHADNAGGGDVIISVGAGRRSSQMMLYYVPKDHTLLVDALYGTFTQTDQLKICATTLVGERVVHGEIYEFTLPLGSLSSKDLENFVVPVISEGKFEARFSPPAGTLDWSLIARAWLVLNNNPGGV